jgi:hypothetical protein
VNALITNKIVEKKEEFGKLNEPKSNWYLELPAPTKLNLLFIFISVYTSIQMNAYLLK